MRSPTLTVDMHADVPIDVVRRRRRGERRVLAERHLPNWRAGGVSGAVLIFSGDDDLFCPFGFGRVVESALYSLELTLEDLAEAGDEFVLVQRGADLTQAAERGKFAVILGVEGAACFGDDRIFLRLLHRLGLRCAILTWNRRNQLGDGAGEEHTGSSLTLLGRAIVEEVNRLGVLLDLSHMSTATFWDVLRRSRQPVCVSHTAARALCDHVRNLTDDQARAVAAAGGVVGVTFYPGFLRAGGQGVTVEDVLAHIEHFLGVVGPDHVGIGPDFVDYIEDLIWAALADSPVPYPLNLKYPPDLEDTSKVGNLAEALRRRGHPEAVVAGIMGENFIRLLTTVMDEATG